MPGQNAHLPLDVNSTLGSALRLFRLFSGRCSADLILSISDLPPPIMCSIDDVMLAASKHTPPSKFSKKLKKRLEICLSHTTYGPKSVGIVRKSSSRSAIRMSTASRYVVICEQDLKRAVQLTLPEALCRQWPVWSSLRETSQARLYCTRVTLQG
ncbi:hypothetical protein VTN31DRAFT_4096 [Thermomyces dupontii]|uniref:uncharacterized protein n=1 Tax=Talaromyces thermophilus TaxID=28565 RepID=UPI0037421803